MMQGTELSLNTPTNFNPFRHIALARLEKSLEKLGQHMSTNTRTYIQIAIEEKRQKLNTTRGKL